MEWRHPSIIAMKGYPYTGKTSIAIGLGLQLRFCLLLSLDDILDAISPPSYTSTPESDQQLTSQAFDILCGLVENQLSLGLSVIIDSPLLSLPHLDRLAALSRSSNAAKFIVVECRIEREYAWQMRFKQRKEPDPLRLSSGSRGNVDEAWYKARDWERDVVKLVKGYNKRLDEPIPGVSRLLLNVDGIVRPVHVIEAIQTLVFCQDDRHLDYGKWLDYDTDLKYGPTNNCDGEKEETSFCKDGHWVAEFKEEGVNYEANCGICETPLVGAAYCCKRCTLALHKSCAEMDGGREFAPHEFPTIIILKPTADPNSYVPSYSFTESISCLLCREAGQGFSDRCHSCIFESHLKSRLIPTIVEHDGHEHKLSFWAKPLSGRNLYKCAACGKEGADFGYECCVCDCRYYHIMCVLLPYPVQEHNHGGHQHPLRLMFSREDTDFDDFPCDYCSENLSPEDWYYYCAECPQTYHLHCAFAKDT